jgi:capsular exopolysaccharide synthesis family protein
MVKHDIELLRNAHDTLLDRISNIDINQNHADVRVTVVNEPVVEHLPISPSLKLVVMLCLLGGFGGGAAIVYVLDVLDERFRSPEELSSQLRAPVLAIVRQLSPTLKSGVEAVHVHASPDDVASEAFRTLRTTLAFTDRDRKTLSITSTEPGDGKTTVLVNLATSFAQAGKRTLIVDADLRRPGMSRLFGLTGISGLSEILRQSDELLTMAPPRICATGIDKLDLLPSGPKTFDPTVLLSSTRLTDLLVWAESLYDQVLIDSPPVLAASDAAIIGRLTDGIILVVQPDKNHRRGVIRAVSELTSMHVPILGVVANRVSDANSSGYYGYGYAHGYGKESGNDKAPHDSLHVLQRAA